MYNNFLLSSSSRCVQQESLHCRLLRAHLACYCLDGYNFLQDVRGAVHPKYRILLRDNPGKFPQGHRQRLVVERLAHISRYRLPNLSNIPGLRVWGRSEEEGGDLALWRLFARGFEDCAVGKPALLLVSAPVVFPMNQDQSQRNFRLIVISKACLVATLSVNLNRNSMFIVCHLVLVVVLSSRVYRELREINNTSQRRTTTDFHTGNLTSAEFADRAVRSTEERVSRKTAEIENDASSIGGSTTRTASFRGSIPSYISDSGDEGVNMHTFRSGHNSQQSSFARHDKADSSDGIGKVWWPMYHDEIGLVAGGCVTL